MKSMPIIILCGGRGIRLGSSSDYIPKAMVKLGHRPIVWHVMKKFSLAGYNNFILALGLKGELIRDYFTQYKYYVNDIQVSLKDQSVKNITEHQEVEWNIKLIDTGDLAMSGARIARCKQYIEEDNFMVTYTDCLSDVSVDSLVEFHKRNKRVATITGVIPPYREGEFLVKRNIVTGLYNAKNVKKESFKRLVNGGYMVFNTDIFGYLNSFNECKLETDVFSKLIAKTQLSIYEHYGFWSWLDTERDFLYLNELVDKNKMYWLDI